MRDPEGLGGLAPEACARVSGAVCREVGCGGGAAGRRRAGGYRVREVGVSGAAFRFGGRLCVLCACASVCLQPRCCASAPP